MNKNVFSVDEETSVMDAVKIMDKNNIGALIVQTPRPTFGIFTQRDLLTRIVAARKSPRKTKIKEVMTDIDLALCMTVQPGFSGQKFEEGVLTKIEEIRKIEPDLMIQVDGGIDAKTGKLCREAGATNLVAASAIFGSKDRKKAIEELRE